MLFRYSKAGPGMSNSYRNNLNSDSHYKVCSQKSKILTFFEFYKYQNILCLPRYFESSIQLLYVHNCLIYVYMETSYVEP